MIRLTFDSSARINSYKNPTDYEAKPEMQARVVAATKLRKFYESSPELIEITCNDGERHKQPDSFKRTRGIAIWGLRGFSEWDESLIWIGNEHVPILENIREIMIPESENSLKDYAQLCEHVIAGREIFVSEDEKKHLRKAAQLEPLGIIVKSAAETIAYLEQQYGFDFSGVTETR